MNTPPPLAVFRLLVFTIIGVPLCPNPPVPPVRVTVVAVRTPAPGSKMPPLPVVLVVLSVIELIVPLAAATFPSMLVLLLAATVCAQLCPEPALEAFRLTELPLSFMLTLPVVLALRLNDDCPAMVPDPKVMLPDPELRLSVALFASRMPGEGTLRNVPLPAVPRATDVECVASPIVWLLKSIFPAVPPALRLIVAPSMPLVS